MGEFRIRARDGVLILVFGPRDLAELQAMRSERGDDHVQVGFVVQADIVSDLDKQAKLVKFINAPLDYPVDSHVTAE